MLPKHESEGATRYDLNAVCDCVIPSQGQGIVQTGLVVALPNGTYTRITPRLGLVVKKLIDVSIGVVNSDYRGEAGVVLFNHSAEGFMVKGGDCIAQLTLE